MFKSSSTLVKKLNTLYKTTSFESTGKALSDINRFVPRLLKEGNLEGYFLTCDTLITKLDAQTTDEGRLVFSEGLYPVVCHMLTDDYPFKDSEHISKSVSSMIRAASKMQDSGADDIYTNIGQLFFNADYGPENEVKRVAQHIFSALDPAAEYQGSRAYMLRNFTDNINSNGSFITPRFEKSEKEGIFSKMQAYQQGCIDITLSSLEERKQNVADRLSIAADLAIYL